MHRCAVACVITATLLASPAMAASASCKEQVAAAFMKQRTAVAFSMVAQVRGESGPVELTVEYIPPDRMRQTINSAGQPAPLETVLVGQRAWSRQGGQWEELLPALVQTIVAQVREAVIDPPKDVGEFECLAKASVDGKEYLAYRSVEKPGAPAKASLADGPVHRTVYIDAATGLPAINVVAEDKPGAAPFFRGTYTYPTNLVIEGHEGAPLLNMR